MKCNNFIIFELLNLFNYCVDLPGVSALGCFVFTIIMNYCILCGQIKGFNRSITTILCQVGSYRTVIG